MTYSTCGTGGRKRTGAGMDCPVRFGGRYCGVGGTLDLRMDAPPRTRAQGTSRGAHLVPHPCPVRYPGHRIAGFTPVPYNIFTFSSGALAYDLRTFIFMSLLSRGARFFLVTFLVMIWGEVILDILTNRLLWLITIFLICAGVAVHVRRPGLRLSAPGVMGPRQT